MNRLDICELEDRIKRTEKYLHEIREMINMSHKRQETEDWNAKMNKHEDNLKTVVELINNDILPRLTPQILSINCVKSLCVYIRGLLLNESSDALADFDIKFKCVLGKDEVDLKIGEFLKYDKHIRYLLVYTQDQKFVSTSVRCIVGNKLLMIGGVCTCYVIDGNNLYLISKIRLNENYERLFQFGEEVFIKGLDRLERNDFEIEHTLIKTMLTNEVKDDLFNLLSETTLGLFCYSTVSFSKDDVALLDIVLSALNLMLYIHCGLESNFQQLLEITQENQKVVSEVESVKQVAVRLEGTTLGVDALKIKPQKFILNRVPRLSYFGILNYIPEKILSDVVGNGNYQEKFFLSRTKVKKSLIEMYLEEESMTKIKYLRVHSENQRNEESRIGCSIYQFVNFSASKPLKLTINDQSNPIKLSDYLLFNGRPDTHVPILIFTKRAQYSDGKSYIFTTDDFKFNMNRGVFECSIATNIIDEYLANSEILMYEDGFRMMEKVNDWTHEWVVFDNSSLPFTGYQLPTDNVSISYSYSTTPVFSNNFQKYRSSYKVDGVVNSVDYVLNSVTLPNGIHQTTHRFIGLSGSGVNEVYYFLKGSWNVETNFDILKIHTTPFFDVTDGHLVLNLYKVNQFLYDQISAGIGEVVMHGEFDHCPTFLINKFEATYEIKKELVAVTLGVPFGFSSHIQETFEQFYDEVRTLGDLMRYQKELLINVHQHSKILENLSLRLRAVEKSVSTIIDHVKSIEEQLSASFDKPWWETALEVISGIVSMAGMILTPFFPLAGIGLMALSAGAQMTTSFIHGDYIGGAFQAVGLFLSIGVGGYTLSKMRSPVFTKVDLDGLRLNPPPKSPGYANIFGEDGIAIEVKSLDCLGKQAERFGSKLIKSWPKMTNFLVKIDKAPIHARFVSKSTQLIEGSYVRKTVIAGVTDGNPYLANATLRPGSLEFREVWDNHSRVFLNGWKAIDFEKFKKFDMLPNGYKGLLKEGKSSAAELAMIKKEWYNMKVTKKVDVFNEFQRRVIDRDLEVYSTLKGSRVPLSFDAEVVGKVSDVYSKHFGLYDLTGFSAPGGSNNCQTYAQELHSLFSKGNLNAKKLSNPTFINDLGKAIASTTEFKTLFGTPI